MRRFGALLLLTITLLAGCGGRESPVSPDEAPETALTEQDVRNMYTAASTVYDWFDLTTLPLDRADSRTEGDLTYYRVDAENLSLPVSTVAEPTDSTLPWQPQPVTITSLADLRETAESYFSPEIVDNLFALSPDHYRDFDGVLYATDGGRGSNLYLLDKTVAAEQVDEDHWTVTVTFWADFEGRELQGDGYFHTVATTGYSTTVLDYAHTPDGWKFTGFCPSDGLDLEADTVYTINYYQDFEVTGAYQDYSDWKLACYLIYADGAYAEAPFDLLARRFLERPEDILHVLALLDSSPYREKQGPPHPNIDVIVAGPGYTAAGRFYREDRADFEALLDALHPETEAEQAVLDKIRAAYESSVTEESPIETEFALIVPGEKRLLTLGVQEGTFPWGYELEGTVTYTGPGDTYGTVYEVDCGNLRLAYSVSPDDSTEYLFRLSTSTHYDQSGGTLCTPRGLYCGYSLAHLEEIYSHVVELAGFQSDTYDACYVYEPGGLAYCKHIAFYITDGVVTAIQVEDLMDGRLLG